jgi:hypothetical protein
MAGILGGVYKYDLHVARRILTHWLMRLTALSSSETRFF